MKKLLLLGIMTLSLNALADSFIRVINLSSEPIKGIWQASGCAKSVPDPEDDWQFTVCTDKDIPPGYEGRYTFGWWMADRSVKVWGVNGGERIGYCNSMDDSSLTIGGDTPDNHRVIETSGC